MTNIKPGDKCWALSSSTWILSTFIEPVLRQDDPGRIYFKVQPASGGHIIVYGIVSLEFFKPVEPKA